MEEKKKIKITMNPIILGVVITIGIITITSLILAATLLNNELNRWVDFITIKSVFGSVSLAGITFLGRFLKKIMDTRTEQEKDENALKKYIAKLNYKAEKFKWKFKQEEIMVDKK